MIVLDNNINPSMDKINAKVELYNGSTLVATCTCDNRLQDFTVERIGQGGKFFGFGVIHKLSINLIDLNRELEVTKANSFKVSYIADSAEVQPYPTFYATEINRDETTNTISVVAYDKLYTTNGYTINDLALGESYSIRDIINAGAAVLGIASVSIPSNISAFDTDYPTGANFSEEKTEELKSVINSAAEVTQTIYYLNNLDVLIFKRLNKNGSADLTISKNDYYSLSSGENIKLATIMHTTDLEDNVHSSTTNEEGVTQYIRENPFYEAFSRAEVGALLDAAIAAIGGTTINQFNCSWDGNFLLEVGDRIALVTEDDNLIYSYLLDDVVEFTGTLSETTQWSYESSESETESSPSSLGVVLNQTTAKVDKANKQIKILTSEVSEHDSKIAEINLNLDQIELNVSKVETTTNTLIETTDTQAEEIDGLKTTTNDLKAVDEAHAGEIDSLKSSTNALAATVTTHTEQIGKLEVTTNNITASVSSLETKTNNLTSTVESQAEKIGKLEVSTEGITASVSSLETKTSELTSTTDSHTEQIGELEKETDDLNSTVATHTEKIGKLEVSTEGITASVSSLETKTNNLGSTVESQGEQIGALESENDSLTSTVESHTEKISSLEISTNNITASVKTLEQNTANSIDGLTDSYESLAREVSLKMSEEDVKISIESELSNGVSKVTTSTGFTFNEEGLRISKDNSGIENLIDNTGMYVKQDGSEVLSATNEGVKAKDLHAVTYLWIGSHSRFEDYEGNRTGCFYIGR